MILNKTKIKYRTNNFT